MQRVQDGITRSYPPRRKLDAETVLDDVLAALATDCHLYKHNAKPRAYEARCGIRFTDLWAPGCPMCRQRAGAADRGRSRMKGP